MHKILFFLLIILITGSCTYVNTISGNGKVQIQTRNIKDVNKLAIAGAFEVYLLQGDTEKLTIVADENLLNHIISDVRGGELQIRSDRNITYAKSLKMYITVNDLNQVTLSGAINLQTQKIMIFKYFKMVVSGLGKIKMDMNCVSTKVELSGSTEISLSGGSPVAEFDISGSGNILAPDFRTDDFVISISGAGKANINVQKKLKVNIAGTGKIEYTGSPEVEQHISGAGSINHI